MAVISGLAEHNPALKRTM
jgi:hypothetical protein